MLKIKNVSACIDTTEILKNINLEIKPGEVHAIMGPSRSGKSSLAHVIQGSPYIKITTGSINFHNKNINRVQAHKRSQLGIFTSFQSPVEIESLTNLELLKALFESRNGKGINLDVEQSYINLVKHIGLTAGFLHEPVNSSAREPGDWKKNEILQLLLLQPELIVLDEIDLDIDEESLECIMLMIKRYLEETDKSIILITNNKKLLDNITPNCVHILVDGTIRETGGTELYKRIVEDGNSQFS